MPVQIPPTLHDELTSAATPEDRFDRLAAHVEKLSIDLHTVKGNLAANSFMTKEMLDGQEHIAMLIKRLDVEKIVELVSAVDSMRGGIKVLGWLERPAKWIAAMGAAIAVVYSFWNQHK